MNMLQILFDPTINGGWNGCAIGLYVIVAVLALTAYTERKKP